MNLEKLKREYKVLPEFQLKKLAIDSYGLIYKDIKNLAKDSIIEKMLAIEFKNCYK